MCDVLICVFIEGWEVVLGFVLLISMFVFVLEKEFGVGNKAFKSGYFVVRSIVFLYISSMILLMCYFFVV